MSSTTSPPPRWPVQRPNETGPQVRPREKQRPRALVGARFVQGRTHASQPINSRPAGIRTPNTRSQHRLDGIEIVTAFASRFESANPMLEFRRE